MSKYEIQPLILPRSHPLAEQIIDTQKLFKRMHLKGVWDVVQAQTGLHVRQLEIVKIPTDGEMLVATGYRGTDEQNAKFVTAFLSGNWVGNIRLPEYPPSGAYSSTLKVDLVRLPKEEDSPDVESIVLIECDRDEISISRGSYKYHTRLTKSVKRNREKITSVLERLLD